MFEIVYQFDPTGRHTPDLPPNAEAARRRLEDGNREFALDPTTLTESHRRVFRVDADDLGLPTADGKAPTQAPFATVFGCSDARVPTEMIFGQSCNDLFVVRVAGNVLGSECQGSIDFALANLAPSLKLVVVLGHSRCGAVTAAVDSFLNPAQYLAFAPSHPLRAIVDRLQLPVRAAHKAIEQTWGAAASEQGGYRLALIDTTVVLNSALTAATLRQEFRDKLGTDREVVYGVYDLLTRRVGIPVGVPGESHFTPGLHPPPTDLSGFDHLAIAVATSPSVRELLTA